MKYDETAAARRAEWLHIRAIATVIYHFVMFPLIVTILLKFMREVVVGLHPLLVIKPVAPGVTGESAIFWAGVGLLVGIGKAISYSSQATKLLCDAEQEKHLRVLVGSIVQRKE